MRIREAYNCGNLGGGEGGYTSFVFKSLLLCVHILPQTQVFIRRAMVARATLASSGCQDRVSSFLDRVSFFLRIGDGLLSKKPWTELSFSWDVGAGFPFLGMSGQGFLF